MHDHTPNPTSMADVWIIVDGQLRFKRLRLRPNDEILKIDVELKPTDRFLTYVTTDGGNTTAFDWMVLGDPVLHLTPTRK